MTLGPAGGGGSVSAHWCPILGQVTPLDLIGPESMLIKMSEDAYVGSVSAAQVDGRPGWSVPIGTSDSDAMTVVLDDETGVTTRMASAGDIAVAAVSDLAVHHDLPESLFIWDGPISENPDRPIRSLDHHRQRLEILIALERALDRRTEVIEVVARSAEPGEAAVAVGRLLDIDAVGAEAVLAMQLRRFSGSERASISTEVQEMRENQPPVD